MFLNKCHIHANSSSTNHEQPSKLLVPGVFFKIFAKTLPKVENATWNACLITENSFFATDAAASAAASAAAATVALGSKT